MIRKSSRYISQKMTVGSYSKPDSLIVIISHEIIKSFINVRSVIKSNAMSDFEFLHPSALKSSRC